MERDSTRMKYKKHCFDREEPQLPWKDSWAEGRQSALSGFSTPAAKPAGDRPHPRSLAAVLEKPVAKSENQKVVPSENHRKTLY